jgi:LysR family nitrogen assimilation transcriptional regulator
MDINQLRTLICVAELGSLSKAADRLCTAQPALSRHVHLLEEELGTRLFDRHGRGMIITEQGRIILKHAQRIMAEFHDLRSSVADENSTLPGRISIGMIPTASEILAVPLITAIRQGHPDVICRIVSAYSLYLLDWIHRGEINIAILYDPQALRSLKSEPLLEEEFFVVAPGGSPLQIRTPFEFRDLKGRSLILPSRDHSLRQIIERTADDCGIDLEVRTEADSYSTLKQLVLHGAGWTILPLAAIQGDITASRLCAAPLVNPGSKRVLELCLPPDRPISRLTNTVRDTLITTVSALVKSGAWPAVMRLQ